MKQLEAYALLQVNERASLEDIDAAFRKHVHAVRKRFEAARRRSNRGDQIQCEKEFEKLKNARALLIDPPVAPPPIDPITLQELAPGTVFAGRFELRRGLGHGAMGVVWLAADRTLRREVALKFLPDRIAHDEVAANDLREETRLSIELSHPGIARVYDFVADRGRVAISMEYIDGQTLSEIRLLKSNKIFETRELITWVKGLCEALEYAHNRAMLTHCDINPSNLMVNSKGHVKVTDFGVAKRIPDSMIRLDPARGTSGALTYMSPQQALGQKPNVSDDIYSVGASLYELLTSKPPFYKGEIWLQLKENIPPTLTERRAELGIEGDPIPLNWEETVAACLAKDPSQRPESAMKVAERLGPPVNRGDPPVEPGPAPPSQSPEPIDQAPSPNDPDRLPIGPQLSLPDPVPPSQSPEPVDPAPSPNDPDELPVAPELSLPDPVPPPTEAPTPLVEPALSFIDPLPSPNQPALAVIDRAPPAIDPAPAVIDRAPAAIDPAPAAIDRAPAAIDTAPAAVDRAPAVISPAPAVVDLAPAAIDSAPAVLDPKPAVLDPKPAVLDPPLPAVTRARLFLEQIMSSIRQTLSSIKKAAEPTNGTPSPVGPGSNTGIGQKSRLKTWFMRNTRLTIGGIASILAIVLAVSLAWLYSSEHKPGRLILNTVPASATVFVDGTARGTTPLVLDRLAPGERQVTIELEGYQREELIVVVQPGDPGTFPVVRLIPKKASVSPSPPR